MQIAHHFAPVLCGYRKSRPQCPWRAWSFAREEPSLVPIAMKRMRDRELALLLCPGLVGNAWLSEQALSIFSEFPPLQEGLWLLLPQDLELPASAGRSLRVLRRRIRRTAVFEGLDGRSA